MNIGRPGPLGNHFSHKPSNVPGTIRVKTRDEAIRRHEEWARSYYAILVAIKSLSQRSVLGCWCKPESCHGDTIVRLKAEMELDYHEQPYRVLVCGTRTWTDWDYMGKVLDEELALHRASGRGVILIEGEAQGADKIAAAMLWNQPGVHQILRFPAEWNTHGKAAGPIRNKKMLAEGQPEKVIAFWDGKSRGTENMIQLAISVDVPVRVEIKEG